MSANKFIEHVYILPEDEQDEELANGFVTHHTCTGRVDILKPAGGWHKALDALKDVHAKEMRIRTKRYMVLLIDFDNDPSRREDAEKLVPDDLRDRVFLIGSLKEPRDLSNQLNLSRRRIGAKLAQECAENSEETWNHDLLKHNANELARMRKSIRKIVFPEV